MTIVPHKVATPPKGDEQRYAEASKLLREQLSDDEVYGAANTWALKLCDEARRYDWSRRKDKFKKGWDGASRAARKLAKHLELGGFDAEARISAAEKKSGIRLSLNTKERAEALANFLHEFSEQQPTKPQPSRLWTTKSRNVYGPLVISFRFEQRIEFPAPSIAVAAALAHGFQEITACFADKQPMVVERFMPLKQPGKPGKPGWSRHGKPCWAAAVAFASAAVNEATTRLPCDHEAARKQELAVKQWLKNHRGRIRYWGFDE
jgi:hypothetical protein